ncbi:MAG TPA: M28 family metallopeptidase [Terriglobales bacterium]|nr:M28 family metallopeptidase [Terriglobales bacterium]
MQFKPSIMFGLLVSLLISQLPLQTVSAQAPNLAGYSQQSSTAERDWEQKFREIPTTENIRQYNQRLSARPHNVGSPYDKDNAEWILSQFKSWGLDAQIETFDVLFPTPKTRKLELLGPKPYTAKLVEPPVPGDPTSSQQSEQLPTYNAYSVDGDVTAPLVYVNYGIPKDYEQLDRMGISVRGAIVIARYGQSWRGIKPKVAAEHGAVGCIIYSDPRDDGYFEGDVFPQGAYRNSNGVQRGSVLDMPVYAGDPLTPGIGSTPGAKRLALKDVKVFTKIPVMPISYGDAQPFLEQLTGPVAPEGWRGALPFTYHVGPGPVKVHMVVASNWDQKPIYDVIARIPGSQYPDEWVIRGNHHDAWVNGSQDPVSGTSPLMEEARALGELLKQGWKPKRTIIYAAWDGEEPGLLGSTEWAETHADELRQHAVAYINSDANSRGFLFAGGSHSLQTMLNDVARDVPDPERQMSIWQRRRARDITQAATDDEKEKVRDRKYVPVQALGSGSDYTVFLDHLGVASANLGFGGEDGGGIYHSIYDDFYWYTHFDDPQFIYGRALAQVAGNSVMRLADADLIPLDFMAFSDTVKGYADDVEKLATDERNHIVEENKELDEGDQIAASDPTKKYVPPAREAVPPYLNFAPLKNALDALSHSAERYQHAFNQVAQNGGAALAKGSLAAVNAKLIESERALTAVQGLPNRPWFEHQIYAPGFYTGYGVKTLPGIREAIEQKKWQEADREIGVVANTLNNEATIIDSAAEELEKVGK